MSLQSQIDILALGLCNVHKSIKAINPKITITNDENKTTQTFSGDNIISVNDADSNDCTTYNPDAGTCVDIMCGDKSIFNDENTIIGAEGATIRQSGEQFTDIQYLIRSCIVPSTYDSLEPNNMGECTISGGDKLVFSGDVTLSEDEKTITLQPGSTLKVNSNTYIVGELPETIVLSGVDGFIDIEYSIQSCKVAIDTETTIKEGCILRTGDKLVFSGKNVTLTEYNTTITLPEGTYVKFYNSSYLENTNLIQPYYQRTVFDSNNITKLENCMIIIQNSD